MIIKAYAKINIGINILSRREDGYHELDMLMLPLRLHDTISLEPVYGNVTHVICDEPALATGTYNLAQKAIDIARAKYGFKDQYYINIHKEIPIRGGLGGGSSNAAAVLKYVLKTHKIDYTSYDSVELAKEVGADVPYFLFNKPSRAQGIGEKINFIKCKNKYYVLLVKPQEGLATKDIFNKCDEYPYNNTDIDALKVALENGNDADIEKYMSNALEKVATDMLPEINVIKNKLKELGLNKIMMTGSGSTVFALHSNYFKIRKIARDLENNTNWQVILTKIL